MNGLAQCRRDWRLIETYRETECVFDCLVELIWVSHITIDIGENRMSSPGRHHEAERKWEREPLDRSSISKEYSNRDHVMSILVSEISD